jgi:ribosome-associated toxin RatA of RatAB toxin-antitoxin module
MIPAGVQLRELCSKIVLTEPEVPMSLGRAAYIAGLLVVGCCVSSSVAAWAAPGSTKAQRYSVKTPYSRIEAGAARIDVAANPQHITDIVCDFGNYSKLSDRFDKSRVVGHSGQSTDVYLQVPILKGAAKIWAVVRFDPIRTSNGEQILTAHMLKGNVERLDATWRIHQVNDHQSRVELEMLIVPKVPVPGSLVTGEVAYAADKAVTGVRDRAER